MTSNIIVFETPEKADVTIEALEQAGNTYTYGVIPFDCGYAIHILRNGSGVGCLAEITE